MTILEFTNGIGQWASRGKLFDYRKEVRVVEILGGVTPLDMQHLLALPFEVSIAEVDGRLYLTTGNESHVGAPEEMMVSKKSRVYLHTHQPGITGTGGVATPSAGDLCLNVDAPLLLAHPKGLILFQNPIRHPLTGEPLRDAKTDPRYLVHAYYASKGISLLEIDVPGKRNYHMDLSVDEREALDRELAEKSGAILEEVAWEDTERLKPLMDMLNLRLSEEEVARIRVGHRDRVQALFSENKK